MSQPITHQTYVLTTVVTVDFAAYAAEYKCEGEPPDVIAGYVRGDLKGFAEHQAAILREHPVTGKYLTVGRADITATNMERYGGLMVVPTGGSTVS